MLANYVGLLALMSVILSSVALGKSVEKDHDYVIRSKQSSAQKAREILDADPRSPLRVNAADHPRPDIRSRRAPRIPLGFHLNNNLTSGNKRQDNYQVIQLFTEHQQQGLTATLYAEYCGNLGACFGEVSMDNIISSARVFGIWLFYDGYGYGIDDDLDVVWIWGDDFLYDFDALDNKMSSVRFVGQENDFLGDSITLFSDEHFKAWEYFVYGDQASLAGWEYLVDSAIVTGTSGWTLYEYEFFEGQSVCLTPANNGNPGLYETANSVGLNFIRSARRGCFENARKQQPTELQKNVVYSTKQRRN